MTSLPSPVVPRRGLLLGWAVLVTLVALVPGAEGSLRTSDPFLCLFCGSRGTADAILNVVFFMPLGFLLSPGLSLVAVAAVGFALSGSIELAQEVLPGRYPTLGDLVWNGAGASLGAVVSPLLRSELEPGRTSPVSAWVAVALPLLYLAGSASLLRPVPSDARYFGQWTADLDFMPVYEGEALEIETQWGPLPDGPLAEDGDPRMEGPWFVRARIVKGPPPYGPAPIASIYDSEKREIVLLGAHEEDLVWRERTLAAALRFDVPDRRILGGLASYALGDTIQIEARGAAGERCLVVGEQEDCGGGVTPGRSWGHLLFLEGPSEEKRRGLDVAWMATLTVLIGILGGSPGRTALLGGLTALGISMVVAGTRLLPPTPAEWAGFTGGILSGIALRPLLRYLVQRETGDGGPIPQDREVSVHPAEAELS